jgi:hypothetical protein
MRRRPSVTFAVAMSLLLLPFAVGLAGPVSAQEEIPEILVGQIVEGRLAPDLPELSARGPFVGFRFEAEAGVRYVAEARSPDFDAYLILARPVGGITEFLQEDDDGAGGSDARLRFTAEESGSLLLLVQEYGPGAGGRFTLSLEERELPTPQPPRPITPGASVGGSLTEESSVLLTEWNAEYRYDLWTFDGVGGDHLRISMESSDFDTYLEFGPIAGSQISVSDVDDDGGLGTDALLRVQLPHDGLFGIRARALTEDAVGAYLLRIEPYTPAPPLRSTITVGERVSAAFTVDDAFLDGGIYFQEWAFEGEATDRLWIRLRSEELDSYLVLGREGPDGGFQELAYNDDASDDDGVNSLLEFQLPESGSYLIRTRTYRGGEIGSYSLEIGRR